MATTKITEKQTTNNVKNAASVLVTQEETINGVTKEALRRASLDAIVAALRSKGINAGYQTEAGIEAMKSNLVKDVQATETGIAVTFWNDDTIDIPIDTGVGFDAISYDQETGYLHITLNGEDVVDPAFIGGGGGGGASGSTITIANRLASRTITITESATEMNILFTATSVDTDTGESTGNLSASWYVNGTRVSIATIAQGNGSFNCRSFLTSGANNSVKLVIEDSYGGTKSMTWTVTVASYSLTWNIDEFANHGSSALNLRLVPSGTGDKTVKVTLDGSEIYSQVISSSGRAIAITVPAQTHGAHTLAAWIETTVDGETLTTTPIRHTGIWVTEGTTTPIVAVLQSALTVEQFSTAAIKYRVYDPQNETATATLAVVGGTSTSVSVGRDTQTWAYRPTESGTETVAITCGATSATITLTVSPLDYDITPVTRGLVMKLDPTGHSNTEADRDSFGYTDEHGLNHPLTFSANFDWVSGGFQLDEAGVTAFVIKRGSYVTFDRSLFNDNAKASGKEIKIAFKVTECRDYDAEIATCKADSVGIKLQAQQATLSSTLQTATVQYCEEKKIEMDINIESQAEDKLAVIWLEGVPSRAIAYEAADNWQQTTPELLKIGSTDCDVWIYNLKMYSTSLTRNEILDNFIADCADTEEMVNRYERNDIFNDNGTINETKLSQVKPELRIIHIWADRMTVSKSDEVTCTVQLIYRNGGAEYEFTAQGVTMKAQGTSSLEYILAALNLDLDFSTATLWQNGNGEDITGYAMTPNSIPVNYLNIKLNVASSENANNVCMTDDYNAFQPYINPARAANPKVRDTIEGHAAAIFFTNTADTAISVGARTVEAGATILYGAGDLCNSKKNYAVFGQDTSTYPNQCCVEISNNNALQCRFMSDDLSTETWGDDKDHTNFEFRYPKKPTAANKAAWQTLLSWVVSTHRAAATGDALLNPVTYDGVEYTTDTSEYRAAKFKAELADHFSVNSLLYHYLTVERRLLPDNRAKNCFVSYEWDTAAEGYRWNFCKDYDNDTMSGNDNSGGLTFTYGMEDTDMVGAAYVFNAADSVLWCNLRDLFRSELETMFRQLEAAGAFSAERILAKWKAYRDNRPEALIIEDMWGKYFSPYIYAQEQRYIRTMLGTKEDQLIQFETYQEPYMSAKYGGSVSTADRISLRANAPETWSGVEPSGDINAIVPYASTYITVKYGNAGTVRIRATRGQTYNVEMPAGASLNDLETYIYSASNIASIGSLAALYTKFADLSSAKKLKQAILGSSEEGYENTSLNSENGGVSFGNNILMEKIDLRGTPNLAQGLDLSALKALEEIYTTGSAITGVTFAQRAPLRVAELNALRQLIARDLTELETFTMSAANLQSVWIENCPLIDTMALVTSATNLTRGRLIGVNWTMNNANLLKHLATLAGISGSGDNTDNFVLTGAAHVEMITADDLAALQAAFPNLTLTYDTEVPTYTVTFKNYNGTTLNTQRVGQGSAPTDPRYLYVDPIPTPTKPSTAAETFTFDGWSWTDGGSVIPDLSAISITANTIIYAHYTSATRTYTVRFYNGNTLLETQSAAYGASVAYSGDAPMNASDGDYATYYLFKGWDKSTGYITEDTDVHAQYESATVPSGKTLAQMNATELHALVKTEVLSPTGANNNVVSSGDTIDIVAGHDFDFSNVTAHEFVSVGSPQTFDGTNYLKPQIDNNDVLLYDTDKSFTLVVDFAFDTSSAAGGCLAACYHSNGFLLRYASGGSVRYGASSALQVSSNGVRQICVIRKQKGDDKLYVYASNKNGNAISYSALTQTTPPDHTAPLAFGAQIANDGYVDNYGKGTVYWAKLWDDDLGDDACKELVAWPRQTFKMQAVGSSQYAFRNFTRADNQRYVNCAFLLKDLLEETHVMNSANSNAGGWKAMPFRTWLNARIFNALPTTWQQLILTVYVHSNTGYQATGLVDPPAEDKIWIPSVKEIGSQTTTSPYSLESDATFTVFTNDTSRIKKLNFGTGAATYWWLRSPYTGYANYFWIVNSNGGANGSGNAGSACGVAFGFCI